MNTPLESATRDHIAAAVAEIISAAVAEIAENTAVIDQAKGMLILLYGVDDQTAFDTLRRHSQNTNIKLRALAEQLVSNYRALSNGDGNPRSLGDCLSGRANSDDGREVVCTHPLSRCPNGHHMDLPRMRLDGVRATTQYPLHDNSKGQ